ncbi:MAG: efflux RND transporter periplasmic adaptor subunit [Deltaproteobacteria bacterium]|nr:MAG: efflux RND transporter periplasmic adaptor subunit [Deltaproteobacteria bacterium]
MRAMKVVGVMVLVGAVVTGGLVASGAASSAEAQGDGAAVVEPAAPAQQKVRSVVTGAAAERPFAHVVALQGNVEARASVDVVARIPGRLVEIAVDEGDRVAAGDPLFAVDASRLEIAVRAARADEALARLAIREKRARLVQVEADLAKATVDHERYERLLASHTVSADTQEKIESRYVQTEATYKHGKILVSLAAGDHDKAVVGLDKAEQDLADATVPAPIGGTVTKVFYDVGEDAANGKPVVHIEDTSTVEVSAMLPAQVYHLVRVGETRARVSALGQDLGELPVTYKSPAIDPRLRTFEVKVAIDNAGQRVASGAMAELTVVLETRQGLGVPSAALVERDGRSAVFVAEGGVARLVDVETGLEERGFVEVRGGDLAAGAAVVTSGQNLLDEGDAVRVVEAAR